MKLKFNPILIFLGFILLTGLLGYALKDVAFSDLAVLLQGNLWTLLAILTLTCCFISCKTFALKHAFQIKFKQNLLFYYKLFLMAALIDLVVFPSRLSGDVFKTFYLKGNLKDKIHAIALYRISTTLGFFSFLAFYFIYKSPLLGILITPLVLLLLWHAAHYIPSTIVERLKLRSVKSYIKNHSSIVWAIMFFTILSVIVDWLKFSLILSLFDVPFTSTFFFVYVLSYALGIISSIPLGFGIKDLTLGAYLINYISFSEITLALVLLRITGEIFSAVIGWILFGAEVKHNVLPKLEKFK